MGLRARCFGDMMINSGSSGNDEAWRSGCNYCSDGQLCPLAD
jgi:hypothetical protein